MKKQIKDYAGEQERTDLSKDQAMILSEIGKKADDALVSVTSVTASVDALTVSLEAFRRESNQKFTGHEEKFSDLETVIAKIGEKQDKLQAAHERMQESLTSHREETARNFIELSKSLTSHREETARNFSEVNKNLASHRAETARNFSEVRKELTDHRVHLSGEMRRMTYIMMGLVLALFGIMLAL